MADDIANAPFGVGSGAEAAGAPSGLGAIFAALYQGAGHLAKSALGASEEMRSGGAYNAKPGVETALTAMGGPLVGVAKTAGEAVLGSGPIIRRSDPIPAFHSSRHDFENFQDVGKIGEGNRAFGEGGYFAENPGVSGQGGYYWDKFRKDMGFKEGALARRLRDTGFDREALAAQTEQRIADMVAAKPHYVEQNRMDVFDKQFAKYNEVIERLRTPGSQIGPRTYEVAIHADPKDMLQWHDPINMQQSDVWDRLHPQVKEAIDDLYDQRGFNLMSDAPEAYTGKDLYKTLGHYDVTDAYPAFKGYEATEGAANPAKHVAAYLESLGMPGIKYLDEFSRPGRIAPGATPTNNYVVFPGQLSNVEVLKKYAAPVAPGLGTALGASMMSQPAPQEQRT